MAKVTIFYDRRGNTLDVWFTQPQKVMCEEVGNDVVLKKNKRGRVVGLEVLNFLSRGQKIHSLRDLRLEGRVA